MNLKLGVIAGDVQNPTKLGLYSDQLNLVYECATEELQVSFKSVEDILTGLENCTTILETIEKHGWHPCMESLLGTTYSQEGLIDMIKNGISKLVEKIKELWNKFVAWVKSFFTSTDAVEKELADGVKKLEAQKSNETLVSTEANLATKTSDYGETSNKIYPAKIPCSLARSLVNPQTQEDEVEKFKTYGGAHFSAIEKMAYYGWRRDSVDISDISIRELAELCHDYLQAIPELKITYSTAEKMFSYAAKEAESVKQKIMDKPNTVNEVIASDDARRVYSDLNKRVMLLVEVLTYEEAIFKYVRRNLHALNNKVKSLNLKYYQDR